MSQAYITMAPNYFGKGKTAEESQKSCGTAQGRKLTDYDTYQVHPETNVDGMGCFCYPQGDANRPKMVVRVRKGKTLPVV